MVPPPAAAAPVAEDYAIKQKAAPMAQPQTLEGQFAGAMGRLDAQGRKYEKATLANTSERNKIAMDQANLDLEAAQVKAKSDEEILAINLQAQKEAADRKKAFADAEAQAMAKKQGLDNIVANTTINPNRIMGKASNQIIAGIATAFGEFSRIMSGGNRNLAADTINRAIDDDVAGQRETLTSRQGMASAAKTQLQDLRTQYDTNEEAALALTYAKIGAAKRAGDELAAKQGGPRALAAWGETKSLLDKRQNDIQNELVSTRLQNQANMLGAALKAKGEGAQSLPSGNWSGATKDKDIYKTAIDIDSAHGQMSDSLAKLKNLVKDVGTELFPTSKAQEAQQLAQDIRLQIKEAYKLGAMSESDYAAVDKLVPQDPTGLRTDAVMTKLDGLQNLMNTKTNAAMKARGFTPATVGSFEKAKK